MEDRFKNDTGSIVYFSHGGGPLPILGEPSHEKMVRFMRALPSQLTRPDGILVISAHWEETLPSVIGNQSPSLLYDYYGFPEEAYALKYPAPGNPELAQRIHRLLEQNEIESRVRTDRGFDHGLFIPLILMYPEADIPMTQLSLKKGLAPNAHIAMGRALRDLKNENILIIGSGFSFHNMSAFTWDTQNKADPENNAFQNWLIDVCTGPYHSREREAMLSQWPKAPAARYCHPREEHLIPLHVCCGIAGKTADLIFDDYILGKRAVAFRW